MRVGEGKRDYGGWWWGKRQERVGEGKREELMVHEGKREEWHG